MYFILSTSRHPLRIFPFSLHFFALLANFIDMLCFWPEFVAFYTQPPNLGRCFLKCISSNTILLLAPTRLQVVLKLTAPLRWDSYSPPASLSLHSPLPILSVLLLVEVYSKICECHWNLLCECHASSGCSLLCSLILVKVTVHRMQISFFKFFPHIFPQSHHLLTGP